MNDSNRRWWQSREVWGRAALSVLSGVLYFLGYAGFGYWPLAFVAFVPMLMALDGPEPAARPGYKAAFGYGWLMGFCTVWGGYHWLNTTLEFFSGFPMWICVLITSILLSYIALMFAFGALLWRVLVGFQVGPTVALVLSYVVAEFAFPTLFPSYLANSLHNVTPFVQAADLGGPLLVDVPILLVNGALFQVVHGLRSRVARHAINGLAVAAAVVAATYAYGVWRIPQVDARVKQAKTLRTGVIQANLDVFSKRFDPVSSIEKHVAMSEKLLAEAHPELIIWPESSVSWVIPPYVRNVSRGITHGLPVPILFGGLRVDFPGDKPNYYNTAFLADERGELRGMFDKRYLLTFAEYMPFSDVFPRLQELSPQTGFFSKGRSFSPLSFGTYKLGVNICYEDIQPGFVRELVRRGDPDVLVNITNDAWFGRSQEPWIHLAMAKFRAIEQRRMLVRATNSGVSAIVDPVGRVLKHTEIFNAETLVHDVPLLNGQTVYTVLGDWPGWLAALSSLALILVGVRRTRNARPTAPNARA